MRGSLLLMVLLTCAPAYADIVSDAPEGVELTVYREQGSITSEMSLDGESNGIAMVTETRTVEVPAGTSVIRFRGVADAIVPQTALLQGLPGVVVEANFDYNLLTPGTLIANSLGRPVRLIRTYEKTGEVTERRGVLRSGPEGVVLDFDGEIEALSCSGLDERLVFDDVPASLTDTPTLSLTVRTTQAGRYPVQLSYLALGFDWSADYVARIHPDGRRLDLSGWITLVNRHDTRFAEAQTHVVAGHLARVEDATQPPQMQLPQQLDRCWPIGEFRLVQVLAQQGLTYGIGSRMPSPMSDDNMQEVAISASFVAQASELGDYKLYTLPVRTTVAPRQMKQVRLLERNDVRFERIYSYRIDEETLNEESRQLRPQVVLRLQNERKNGLGLPLPGGTMSVMQGDDRSRYTFAGEQTLKDTPVGLPADIEYARAMDVWITPRVVDEEEIESAAEDKFRTTLEVQIGNDKPTPIVLEVRHPARGNVRVVSQSKRHSLRGGDFLWSLRLRPGQREVLRYTLETEE
jgi:hypothetical protein